ncbi:tetratricopeptide repeat-containing sulfotransferase family protein [Rhodanobacter sp. BL-MT-08]
MTAVNRTGVPTSDSHRVRDAALDTLALKLTNSMEADWLDSAQKLILKNDAHAASKLLETAVDKYPRSVDLRRSLASVYLQTGRTLQAEDMLRALLLDCPNDAAAAFLLARMFDTQGRAKAMAETLRALFKPGSECDDADLTIAAIELLDGAGKQADAASICEARIAAGSTDARLHAYAGMLQIQLGSFDVARERYLYAINNHAQAFEWNAAVALSNLQRYRDAEHPDLVLFKAALDRVDMNASARASLLFALGKAHDDLENYALAAKYFFEANALVRRNKPWSRKFWHNAIASRLTARARSPLKKRPANWAPLFIVGVPRSGTTLAAELLSRHPDVCNRGELPWLPQLAQTLELSGYADVTSLEKARCIYEPHLLQDDGFDAKWFVDKEPLNLLRVDVIMAMYPNAKIVFCERNPRDTAVSLWSQYFSGGTQGYAYDLSDIRVVLDGCKRMKQHWLARYPQAIQVLKYEALAADPASCLSQLVSWLDLAPHDFSRSAGAQASISTASLWQARQPVYTSSVDRWRHYVTYLPDLLKIPEV